MSTVEYINNIEKEISNLRSQASTLKNKVGRFAYENISRNINILFNQSIHLRNKTEKQVKDGHYYKTVKLTDEEILENYNKALECEKRIIKEWESNIRIKNVQFAVEWGRKNFPGINDPKWNGETPFGLIEATKSPGEMVKWCIDKGCDLDSMWKIEENKYRVLNILDKRCRISGWKVMECDRCIDCKDYNTIDDWYKKIYGEKEFRVFKSLRN